MKPRTFSRLLCWTVASIKVNADSDCAPYQTLSLEVGAVRLSNGQTARGVTMGVGTPAQQMSFLPLMPLNNSFVYGTTGYCNTVSPGWSDDGCTTFRGGAYDPTTSSTTVEGGASAFASDTGTFNNTPPFPKLAQMSDTVVLDSNLIVESFPIGIVLNEWTEGGFFPQAALGLGPNSTLLSTLVDTGTIASRTFSWFWGLNGELQTASTQLNGSLVLGGYDKAKVTGPGYTQPIAASSSRCASGLFLNISDVIANWPDGTSESLSDPGNSTILAACIEPALPSLMTIPQVPYFDNFEELTGATMFSRSGGLDYFNMRYDTDQTVFAGDVTLEFTSGLSVRVDNAQYIGADITINKTTGALEANSTGPVVAMYAYDTASADYAQKIGRNLFSAAYLMVNYDAGEFTIWNANPTADQDLVAVDSAGAELNSLCPRSNETATVTAAGATASNTSASTATSAPATENTSVSPRVIAGGVVGGVVGIAALAAVAWLVLRRRKAARKDPGVAEPDMDHSGSKKSRASSGMLEGGVAASSTDAHEIGGSAKTVHELPLPGDGGPRLEAARYELPSNTVMYEM